MQKEEGGDRCKARGQLTLLTHQNTHKVQSELFLGSQATMGQNEKIRH